MSDRFDINHVYNILGLKPGASVDQVKQAYRQMAKTWHPDCFLEPRKKQHPNLHRHHHLNHSLNLHRGNVYTP
ncbi:J domain-containing protein [Nostoc sp.]|uniref:J domain-containing protein n=1 Tax=Nostoc sp. TaxID=1180 RepID=UPI002FF54981